jgi:hypothetical protein
MAALIAFVLGNFTLTFLVLGIAAGLIAAARAPGGFTRANLAEGLLAYFILFTIAIAYFYNFVFHVFFGDLAASFIGWANSPFQAEVGYASLGFAAVGLLAFKGNCMAEHIKSILATGNMAPGNAGIMLYSDIFLPLIGFALLWFKRSADTGCAASGMASGTVRG